MRLDKYLKVSRLVKRRTVANELCDAGHVEVNSKVQRASYDVKPGEIISLRIGSNEMKVRVENVNEYSTKESASEMSTAL